MAARACRPRVENLAYPARQVLCLEEKRRIARLAARHVPDHASLFINIGTTTEEVAKALLNHQGLSVITNNLNVASILAGKPDFRVIVAGGLVRSRDRGLVGEATLDLIRQFKVDIGIIGISGIDLDGALLDFDYREVRVAQAIIENSRRVFLTADHTKFGRNAMVRLGGIQQIHALFTDQAPPPALAQHLRAADVALHVAGAEDSTQAPDCSHSKFPVRANFRLRKRTPRRILRRVPRWRGKMAVAGAKCLIPEGVV